MARRSSRISNAGSLIRAASSVVVPGLRPPSTWALLTQDRRASGWTPSSSPILRTAPPWPVLGQPVPPTPVLVARSHSSPGYFLKSHNSDPYLSPLPPSNPGRLNDLARIMNRPEPPPRRQSLRELTTQPGDPDRLGHQPRPCQPHRRNVPGPRTHSQVQPGTLLPRRCSSPGHART